MPKSKNRSTLSGSKTAAATRMILAIIGGIAGFCFVVALYFLDGIGTHYRAGGTLGGYGESANEHVDSSVQMTYSNQYYLVLAIFVPIFASISVYLFVSFVQSKIASRKTR